MSGRRRSGWRLHVIGVSAVAIGFLFAGPPKIWPFRDPRLGEIFTAWLIAGAAAFYLASLAYERNNLLWTVALALLAFWSWNPLIAFESWGLMPAAANFPIALVAAIILAAAGLWFARPQLA